MSEVLSQNEIDSLLSAISGDAEETATSSEDPEKPLEEPTEEAAHYPSVEAFLEQSSLAETIHPPLKIVLCKKEYSLKTLRAFQTRQSVPEIPSLSEDRPCQLYMGKTLLAEGFILNRNGHSFFKISKTGDAL